MAGWRVGFACGQRGLIHALAHQELPRLRHAQPIQIGAIVALRGPQDFVTETVEDYRERRDALDRRSRPGRRGLLEDREAARHDVRLGADPGAVQARSARSSSRSACSSEAKVAVVARRRLRRAGEGFVRFALVENTPSHPPGGARHPALPARSRSERRADERAVAMAQRGGRRADRLRHDRHAAWSRCCARTRR